MLISDVDWTNTSVRDIFAETLPSKPYCTDDLAKGLTIRCRSIAIECQYIQLNPPWCYQWMVHDIDKRDATLRHRDNMLPEPNFIAINPANLHAHSGYLLRCPVARHDSARMNPLRYFSAIELGFRRRLDADRHYVGLIAKNPTSSAWRTEWRHPKPFELDDLASWLCKEDMRPEPTIEQTFGAGRNVTLFDELRMVAYNDVRPFKRTGSGIDSWQKHLFDIAKGINCQFRPPLRFSEVKATARSVAKWTFRNFSEHKFSGP